MIRYFKQIPGLEEGYRGLYVGGKIRPMKSVGDFYKIKDYLLVKDRLQTLGLSDVEVKISVTGPVTLGVTCAANAIKHYKGILDQDLYRDLSDALSPIIDELLRLGSLVQIDEPGISSGFMEPGRAVEIVNYMISGLSNLPKGFKGLSAHICGDLTKIKGLVSELLKLKVETLSFAFRGKAEGKNLSAIDKEPLESSKKFLGVGCVSVTAREPADVDSVEQILETAKRIVDKVGLRNVAYFHPDCGLRGVSVEVAERILHRLKLATEKLESFLNCSQLPTG